MRNDTHLAGVIRFIFTGASVHVGAAVLRDLLVVCTCVPVFVLDADLPVLLLLLLLASGFLSLSKSDFFIVGP